MRLSVAVMAHPSRAKFVKRLLPQLPKAKVVWDERDDRWDTGRRSLLAHGRTGYHLIVQDDAILCKDFLAGANIACEHAGGKPVGFYAGNLRPRRAMLADGFDEAIRLGTPWVEMEGPWWGVAIALPSCDIPALVAWGDDRPHIQNYDMRVSRWYAERGIDCRYTIPCLVDHRPVRENPSLVAGRVGNRRAHLFTGGSPLRYDWAAEPVRVDAGARVYRHRHTGRLRRARAGTVQAAALERSPVWVCD